MVIMYVNVLVYSPYRTVSTDCSYTIGRPFQPCDFLNALLSSHAMVVTQTQTLLIQEHFNHWTTVMGTIIIYSIIIYFFTAETVALLTQNIY